jgi:CRISPR-associated protein Cmr2
MSDIKNQVLLKFQIGPVQDFIAQARSTRDLWSGSYLLSWLMAHAIQTLIAKCKPESLIFPSPKGQPLLEWLNNPEPNPPEDKAQAILTPNLPNLFLAVVPEGISAEDLARQAADELAWRPATKDKPASEWTRICNACLQLLNDQGVPLEKSAQKRWDAQVEAFWQITWQAWLLLAGEELETAAKVVPLARGACGEWARNLHLVSHRLDGRRSLRDFAAWQGTPLVHKDHFSGKEEVVVDAEWLERARRNKRIGHLFRNDDELGSINLIKRIWHLAYLANFSKYRIGFPDLERARTAFDSVPAVALAPWRNEIRKAILESSKEELEAAFCEFANSLVDALPGIDSNVAESVTKGNRKDYEHWLNHVDAAVFHPSSWIKWESEAKDKEIKRRVQAASEKRVALEKHAQLGRPSPYYAVLAMDGDEMGKWLSGTKVKMLLIDRKWHTDFSWQLSQFALSDAARIVESDKHQGKLIYAGGDDVLALLPATRSVECACELHAIFSAIQPPGQLTHLTASIGIAIGHMKEPLQDMIDAARYVEKLAKASPVRSEVDPETGKETEKLSSGWNRNALAISLYKRSGETIVWGATFDSPAFALWSYFKEQFRSRVEQPKYEPPISGRFPHRLIELLSRYSSHDSLTPKLKEIALKDFEWVVSRQADGLNNDERSKLVYLADQYLKHLLGMDESTGKQTEVLKPRPLSEFYNLFAIEAFIARQAE